MTLGNRVDTTDTRLAPPTAWCGEQDVSQKNTPRPCGPDGPYPSIVREIGQSRGARAAQLPQASGYRSVRPPGAQRLKRSQLRPIAELGRTRRGGAEACRARLKTRQSRCPRPAIFSSNLRNWADKSLRRNVLLSRRLRILEVGVGHDSATLFLQNVLSSLVWEHGPPLARKTDNGPGFIARDTRKLLAAWSIQHLRNPPRTPQYNRSCEAAGGSQIS